MSRITLGKIELQRAPVELAEIVTNAVAMSRAQIDAAGHRLSVTLPGHPVTLSADAVRLCQVLSNLLNNAARYTEDGGAIALDAAVEVGEVVIRVRDTGIGIPQPMLERVFDLFSQLDAPERSPRSRGLGIGLAMVRKLVTLHGGAVEARSEGVGKGSEFIVRLPVRDSVLMEPSAAQDAAAPAGSVGGRSVLVVDDNVDAADSLALLLTGGGARVQVAYDAAAALELLSDGPPDLIVLDIDLPDMNGYALASRIRQDRRLDTATLVALTGFGQEEDRRRSRAAGFDHHLTKPASLDALYALLSPAAVVSRSVIPGES
jgi:CheY-like chemotaxis protein